MNVTKGIAGLFGGVGVLMVLIGRELKDRGGEVGDAASVFVVIGMIWTAVAIGLLVLSLVIGRSTSRDAELLRDTYDGPDG